MSRLPDNGKVPTPVQLVPLILAVSFAAGLNLYATVATLGLLSHYGVLTLPTSLHAIESPVVIAVALLLFVVEFFADKVPAFDLVWNALHTFIRVPAAAVIAYAATSQLPWHLQMAATAAGGLVAFAAHSGKLAARTIITPSPEPLSNIGLSLGEDGLAIFLAWFVGAHPWVTVAIVVVLLFLIVVTVKIAMRAMRALFRGAKRALPA